ncbi:hypothetical protein F5Y04DRAFT_279132 [Hypomontagnella monticulosa]|nr:hypothetical protein F5Y04DRAFT_279132 [Hypomontagnella monticulosa]
MELRQRQISDEAASVASTLSWNTFLSRTSVSSLSSAAFSDSGLSHQVHGLDDVLNTVRALSLRRIQYGEIERQDVVGEGETFVVERCVVRNQVLAVKHLKVNLSPDDGTFRRRLQSVILELRIMRHAPLRSHPNILTVLGYGWNMGGSQIAPYLLVQYAPYGTLRQYLRHSKPEVSVMQKEMLLGDVAAAMNALHVCGIIHGDVKLDNVLVFHSWDRPAKSIAKIADFGHSLVISGKEDGELHLRYGGTSIYNAPEVHNQKICPIDRAALHKCDIWAFGVLTWETFLDGDEYIKHIPEIEPSVFEASDEPIATVQPGFLELAKNSLPFSTSNLRGGLIRSVLNMTLRIEPTKRISNLTKLPFMSKWHSAGVQGLEADLALHFGSSQWSYEMFRPENGREIPWEHEEQIYQGLRRTYNNSHNRNGDIAWQLALCHHTGFGESPNPGSAHQLALAAEKLNHPVAAIFAPLLTPNGPPESYIAEKKYSKRITDLLRQNKAIIETTPLVEACCKGDIDSILSQLKTWNPDSRNILHLLFMLEDNPRLMEVLAFLFSNKSKLSIDQPTETVFMAHSQWPLKLVGSPLVFAISVGSRKTVRHLLLLGANPCSLAFASGQFPVGDQRSLWTPVHVATQYHCHEILSDLLRLDSVMNHKNNKVPYACALSYSSSLECMALHGNSCRDALLTTISILKESKGLTAAAPNGMTALMQAIDFQDTETVSALLNVEKGIARVPFRDPTNPDNFNYAIHFAAQLGARRNVPEAVQIIKIIEGSSDNASLHKNFRDSVGRSPLHLAVTGPSKRSADWILLRRPDLLDMEDNYGKTPLHYCYSATNADFLLSKGAEVNYTDKFGLTSLHWACFRGDFDIVRCLLEKKPLLDLKNNSYGTPLHCAIIRGSLDVTMALLEASAPINEVDRFGDAPLHVASSLCRHNIIRLLVQYGADVHQEDSQGRTAASIAQSLGTIAGMVAYDILRGDDAPHNTGSIEALYTRYLETGFNDSVLPIYQPRPTTQSSESASHGSDIAVSSVELIDHAGIFELDTRQDSFNIEDSEPEPQGRERKLAEFVYYLNNEYGLPFDAARDIIRNLAEVFNVTAYVNFEPPEYSNWPKRFSVKSRRNVIEGLHRASYLIHRLTGDDVSKESQNKLYDAVAKKHWLLEYAWPHKLQWENLGIAVAISLELGRPAWEAWGLDEAKVRILVYIAKSLDQAALPHHDDEYYIPDPDSLLVRSYREVVEAENSKPQEQSDEPEELEEPEWPGEPKKRNRLSIYLSSKLKKVDLYTGKLLGRKKAPRGVESGSQISLPSTFSFPTLPEEGDRATQVKN